jgi:hypothetical protein
MAIAYLGSPNITIGEALDLAVSQYWGNRNRIVATYYTSKDGSQ